MQGAQPSNYHWALTGTDGFSMVLYAPAEVRADRWESYWGVGPSGQVLLCQGFPSLQYQLEQAQPTGPL